MAKLDANSTLKRLRNRYRLVVMNEDTYEEVVKFKLSRLSVYIGLSTLFVVLVGLTIALIVFTPLNIICRVWVMVMPNRSKNIDYLK